VKQNLTWSTELPSGATRLVEGEVLDSWAKGWNLIHYQLRVQIAGRLGISFGMIGPLNIGSDSYYATVTSLRES